MLKFSANISLLFTEVPFLERFKLAKQCGFEAVEIQFPYQFAAEEIAVQLAAHDMKLVLFNVAADDLLQGGAGLACVPEKKARFAEAVGQAFAYAEILKPELINVLPGRCVDQSRYEECLQTFMENLLVAGQAFSAIGVKTVFEAINTFDMPGFIINTGEQMLMVLEQLNNPYLSMQYDIYHSRMMAADPGQFIKQYADKIGHIQFADCPGRAEPGTGEIDFNGLFSIIGATSYLGWVGAEYKPSTLSQDSFAWLAGNKH